MVMKSKGKFLVLTDMREAVGVETVVGRKVVVNEDHIIKIAAMEPHIAEVNELQCYGFICRW
jgi:hypothetical protein